MKNIKLNEFGQRVGLITGILLDDCNVKITKKQGLARIDKF